MNEPVDEKVYPIEARWILKILALNLSGFILIGIFFIVSSFNTGNIFYVSIFVLFTLINVVIMMLRRKTFHYTVDTHFLYLKQGILSKQERHIPYGVIQHTFIKQDILDRLLGLASLVIENASAGAGAYTGTQKVFGTNYNQNKRGEALGFTGNKVSIPGLDKNNAELLKGVILQKMKENPLEDSQSGL